MDDIVRIEAFHILGIAPTGDGRAIRSAFLRLARIYHPDRFVDMPDDVRSEAERRMKDANAAYEFLRAAASKDSHPKSEFDEAELRQKAWVYREAIEARRKRDERDRARWQRWDEVERVARDRAERESVMAEHIAEEVHGFRRPNGTTTQPPKQAAIAPARDPLGERLAAARRAGRRALAPPSEPKH